MINFSEKDDISNEDVPEYFGKTCCTILKLTNLFQFGKHIVQTKRVTLPDITDNKIYKETLDEVTPVDNFLD